jgi:NAD(P)-dependent dehydrogenase (short-subunit alcohol dehydrogenase family)
MLHRPSPRTGPFLAGRLAFVTGAAGDIGRAVAVRLAAAGATVVATDLPRAAEGLTRTEATCRDVGDGGGTVVTEHVDVTDEGAVEAAVADVAERLGPPDTVVTSAGVQGLFVPTARYPVDDLRTVLDVNVVGTFTVVRACAAALVDSRRPGAMVALASMAGVTGAPNMVGYSASKAAVLGLVRSAAKDLAPHDIRINAVSPGFIGPGAMWERQVRLQAEAASQYYADTPDEVAAEMIGQVPLRRYGSLDEVAAVIAFLLSDDASYVTGTNTEISGGSA